MEMNNQPTPETDAFTTSFTSIDDPKGKKQWVPSEFARVLERERDEAREKCKEQHEALLTLAEHGENEIQKLLKELTETRNKMADALQEVDLRTLDFERIKQDLHAARAEAAKWEAIAFWEASANSSTKKEKELKQHRQADRELHSTDPMWQKPLSTSNPIPYTTNL